MSYPRILTSLFLDLLKIEKLPEKLSATELDSLYSSCITCSKFEDKEFLLGIFPKAPSRFPIGGEIMLAFSSDFFFSSSWGFIF
jgi:hypothetical protein